MGQDPFFMPHAPDGIEPPAAGPRRSQTKVWLLFAIIVIAAIGAAYAYERTSASHFFPGTRIGDVAVGSRSADEAAAILHDRFVVPLREPMTLTAPDFKTRISPWKMGMRVDVDHAVGKALVDQQAQSFLPRLRDRAFGDPTNIRLKPTVDDDVFTAFLRKTFRKIDQEPQDARLDVSGDRLDVIPHKLGRTVDKRLAEGLIFAALTDRQPRVEVPVKVVEPELKTSAFKRVLLISTGSNRLTLYKNGKVSKRYGVATGTGGYPTPHGQFRITAKRMYPTWYNPNSDWSQGMPAFIPPGPNNPLGTRALNLSASGIRVHGTPDAWSIGTNASHGCIRMHMRDAEELYERVEVGTPVLIVY